MAKPSKPSVKFTALVVPTKTHREKRIKSQLETKNGDLRKVCKLSNYSHLENFLKLEKLLIKIIIFVLKI